jgi:hypothetical protein
MTDGGLQESGTSLFCPQAGRPRHRNTTAPVSFTFPMIKHSVMIAPVKVVYAVAEIYFLTTKAKYYTRYLIPETIIQTKL